MPGLATVSTSAAAQRPRLPLLALPAELTIYTVGELHPQWLARLAEPAEPDTAASVQAAAVDEIDAAGLQMLLALDRALVGRGRSLHFDKPSAVLSGACAGLGLGAWLQARTGEGATA